MAVTNAVPLRVTIAGLSPLLLNNAFGPDGRSLDPRGPVERKLYLDEFGRPGIPRLTFMEALIRAGFRCKVGRRQLSRVTMSFVPEIVKLRDDFLALDRDYDAWSPYELRYTDRTSGQDVRVVVPRFQDWRITLYAHIHKARFPGVTNSLVQRLFDEAGGDSVGIGFHRPEQGGTYGRFHVRFLRWGSKARMTAEVA